MNIYYTNPNFNKLPYELKNHIYSYLPENPIIKCMIEYNTPKICGICKKKVNRLINIGINACIDCAEDVHKNFKINWITIGYINNLNIKKNDNNNIIYIEDENTVINLKRAKIIYNFIKINKLINIKLKYNDFNSTQHLIKNIYYLFKVFCNNSTNKFSFLLNYIQDKDINTVSINDITVDFINNSNVKKNDNNDIIYIEDENTIINLNRAKILYNSIKKNKLINIKMENNDINGKHLIADIYYLFKVFCNNLIGQTL